MLIGERIQPINRRECPVDVLQGWATALIAPCKETTMQLELVDAHVI